MALPCSSAGPKFRPDRKPQIDDELAGPNGLTYTYHGMVCMSDDSLLIIFVQRDLLGNMTDAANGLIALRCWRLGKNTRIQMTLRRRQKAGGSTHGSPWDVIIRLLSC